jgi:hypothetical protein
MHGVDAEVYRARMERSMTDQNGCPGMHVLVRLSPPPRSAPCIATLRKKLTCSMRGARQQGKVNEGTFGVVFKAIKASEKSNYDHCQATGQLYPNYFAIKKPKNNAREGEGFNKDAVREIALLMELKRGTGVKAAPLDTILTFFAIARM